jgi:hypothetical protein
MTIKFRLTKIRKTALTLMILILVGSLSLNAQAEENREYLIKVGFIYNLAKFLDYPSGSFKNDTCPFILVIYGTDPFGSAIEAIRDRPVKGRRLVVKQAQRMDQLEEAHMVYISSSEKKNLKAIFAALSGRPVLTVSDQNFFAEAGGMVGLVTVEEKIKLEINLEAVKASRIGVDFQLLKLAKIVASRL